MHSRFNIYWLSAFLVTTATGVQGATSLPPPLPESPSKALVVKYCTGACHEIQRIEEAQGSNTEWVTRIRRMIRRGAVIPQATMEPLATYLAQALPPRVSSQSTAESPITTTVSDVALRPIQTWVRAAGTLQDDEHTLIATLPLSNAALVKVGQRVRAFALGSRSSMQQARVSRVIIGKISAQIQVRLTARAAHDDYLLEIITEQDALLSIANEAIIEEGDHQVVYVQRKSGDFEQRTIATGVQGELFTHVTDGLQVGEHVVTFGSFFIDAEYKMKSASKTSAQTSVQTESVVIDYRSNPITPIAGDNEVNVTVKQSNGASVDDANVMVTYYMPAMASMNMPEMRDEFSLTHHGSGSYTGTARLSMAGTWQVTVTASKDGELIGTKALTVIAK